MLLNFLDALRSAGIPATIKEHLLLLEALDREVIERRPEDFYYLSRAIYVKDEGLLDRFDQVFAACLQGHVSELRQEQVARFPKNGCAPSPRNISAPRRWPQIESLGRWDEIMETLKQAARGTGRSAPGRQQVDRHRRHQPLRQFGLQSRRRAHRRREQTQARDQGVGKARIRRISTTPASWARATSRWRCAACAASRARERPRNSTSTRRSTAPRAQGWLDIRMRARAAQCGEAAAVPRCRRIDGPVYQADRGTVQRGDQRIQEPRILLLPQLPLRRRVEGQPPPLDRAHRRPGTCSTNTAMTTRSCSSAMRAMSPYEITHPGGSVEHMNEEAGRGLVAAGCRHLSGHRLAQPRPANRPGAIPNRAR